MPSQRYRSQRMFSSGAPGNNTPRFVIDTVAQHRAMGERCDQGAFAAMRNRFAECSRTRHWEMHGLHTI